MNIQYLFNGDIEMFADELEKRDILKLLQSTDSIITAENIFIENYLEDFERVAPEDVGALTDAPLISDGEDVFGFMDYQIRNFLEELADGEKIVWKKA